MAIQVKLSEEEEKKLESLHNKPKDYRSERALIVLLNAEGKTAPEIAGNIKRHPNTVRSILHSFKENRMEGLKREYSDGRPNEKKTRAKELIGKVIQKSPQDYGYPHQMWTKNLFIDLYQQKHEEEISPSTMERALNEAGYSWKRPTKTVPKEAPSKEEKLSRLEEISEEINEFAKNDSTEIMFVDESHFSTEPNMIKGWYKTGESFFLNTPQKRESCTIFGALTMKEQRFYWKSSKKGNSKTFMEFIHQLRQNNSSKKLAIILDNVSYHKSKYIKAKMSKYPNIELFNLPTYSPEYNPVEQVWRWLKNLVYHSQTVAIGINDILSRIRKLIWHWMNDLLNNPLNIGTGKWDELMINIIDESEDILNRTKNEVENYWINI